MQALTPEILEPHGLTLRRERRYLSPAEEILAAHVGSPQTCRTYKHALEVIAKLAGSDFESMEWERLHIDELILLCGKIRNAGWRPATVNVRMVVIRKLAEILYDRERLTEKHLRTLKRHTKQERNRTDPRWGRALEIGELAILRNVCQADPIRARGLRDGCLLLALGVGAGLRRDEMSRLEISDVNLKTGEVATMGKGRKQRTGVLAGGALRWAQAWAEVRGTEPGPFLVAVEKNGRLRRVRRDAPNVPPYWAARLKPCDYQPLAGHSLNERVKLRGKEAGIGALRCHDLRRSYVTLAKAAGIPLDSIALACGHESVDTTRRYIKRDLGEVRKASEAIPVPF